MLPDFLFTLFLHQPLWIWLMFLAIVIAILFLDLGVLEKGAREISAKKSLALFMTYAGIALMLLLLIFPLIFPFLLFPSFLFL